MIMDFSFFFILIRMNVYNFFSAAALNYSYIHYLHYDTLQMRYTVMDRQGKVVVTTDYVFLKHEFYVSLFFKKIKNNNNLAFFCFWNLFPFLSVLTTAAAAAGSRQQ